MSKIAILTDSSATFSKHDIKKYPDLFMLPINLILPDGSEVADDEDEISYSKFYEILETGPIKTSQIAIGQMMAMWDQLLESYDHVVFAGLSKGLSGQFNTMTMLANDAQYKGKVTVIDTDGVTEILSHIVMFIYEYVKAGKPIEHLQDDVNELKKHYTAFIIPKSMDTLCRGGRIKPAAAKLAKLLKITPLLIYDGEIDKYDKTRTFSKAIAKSVSELKNKRSKNKIIVVWANSDSETKQQVLDIIKEYGISDIEEYEMPRVIAAHTGANTIGLVSWDDLKNN